LGIFVGTMRQAQVFEAGYGFAFPVWKMNPHDLRVVASPGVVQVRRTTSPPLVACSLTAERIKLLSKIRAGRQR